MTTSTAVVYNREIGPGYAIPADENVRNVIDVLKRGEEVEYGFMGITFSSRLRGMPVDRDLRMINSIMPQSPAATAGLLSGDTITKINDIAISNYADLLLYTGSALAGSKLKITVNRPKKENVSKEHEFILTLGKYSNLQPFMTSVRPEPVFGLRVDYLTILLQRMDLGQKNRPDTFTKNDPTIAGVCVREILPNSPAANKFKVLDNPNEWIITHVNGTAVSTPADFYKAAKGQPSVKLALQDWDANRHELTLP
jgi:serine protease Do